jgi:type I restriction enzyme, S subunit
LQFVDVDDTTLAAFRLERGDLLFNRTNSIDLVGRTALFDSDRESVFASYLVRLRVDRAVWLPEFINYYLNRSTIQRDLKKLASRGVSQSNINATKLKAFPAPLASLKVQLSIVQHLTAADYAVRVHDEKVGRLRELFVRLLNQLMTGRLSLEDIDVSTLREGN